MHKRKTLFVSETLDFIYYFGKIHSDAYDVLQWDLQKYIAFATIWL